MNTARLATGCWIFGILLGVLRAWSQPHPMGGDGISYLDLASALARGDWAQFLSTYWSPLYPALLGATLWIFQPSPYWEFAAAGLLNLVIYLVALASFHFFLIPFVDCHHRAASPASVPLPRNLLLAIGYTTFFWTSLDMIGIDQVTPDMFVAAVVYLVCGLWYRMLTRPATPLQFAMLGVLLGIGYLTKAVMFPLAFVFLAVWLWQAPGPRRRLVLALGGFALMAGPLVWSLSRAKNHLTIGDAARLNYSWSANGTPVWYHWQGQPPGTGHPVHPTRKLLENPPVFEFASALPVTYPPWFDPPYWHEGLEIRFDARRLGSLFLANVKMYLRLFSVWQIELALGLLILCVLGGERRLGWRPLVQNAPLLAPALAALFLYSFVYTEWRYLAPFATLLWLSAYSSIRLPPAPEFTRMAWSTMAVVLLVVALRLGYSTAGMIRRGSGSSHVQWRIAEALAAAGLRPGDKVARIAAMHSPLWARPARVQVIAEIPLRHAATFRNAEASARAEALRAFARAGARAVVAESGQPDPESRAWKRIEGTDAYLYLCPP